MHEGAGMSRRVIVLVAATVQLASWQVTAVAEAPSLSVSGTFLVLPAEAKFTKDLAASTELRRKLTVSNSAVTKHEKAFQQGSQAIDELRAQIVQLNTQLAALPAGDVENHNRLVGMINALNGKIELFTSQRNKAEEEGRKLRAALNEAREAYIQFALDMRKQADAIAADYASKANDQDIKDVVAAKSAADGRNYSFGASAAFQATVRKLAAMEDAVLSETIELQRDGKVLHASVCVNEGKPRSMVVDSGSSMMLVPLRFAEEFDVVPTEYDQKVTCVLANGSQVPGTAKKLRSVRVGKFTVENVECIVLGAEATEAELLLGMSFLGKFEFKLDPDAGTLQMSRIEQ